MSAPAGSKAVLQCQSQRMVWTQDGLSDRQRVVHWDLYPPGRDYKVERVCDMFSAGSTEDMSLPPLRDSKTRVRGPDSVWPEPCCDSWRPVDDCPETVVHTEPSLSLFPDVGPGDKGIYSCNLHHHYCHLYESTKIQLNLTKSALTLGIVDMGVLCPTGGFLTPEIGTGGSSDGSADGTPGVRTHLPRSVATPVVHHVTLDHRADRLVDLYASGERRGYGPLFIRQKMNISELAFSRGDFSLSISDLQPPDQGLYSCHLHHHYCGLHERRLFHLSVTPPWTCRRGGGRGEWMRGGERERERRTMVEPPRVINVILPEHRAHFLQQLGYILATLLLLALVATAIVLLTRQHRKRGLEYNMHKSEKRQVCSNDFVMDATELKAYNNEEIRLGKRQTPVQNQCRTSAEPVNPSATPVQNQCRTSESQCNPSAEPSYKKNNILKERAELSNLPPPKVIDLDKVDEISDCPRETEGLFWRFS
ncbi:matrix remodeling-associated protein 8-like [Polyodon spathula]|uniref:matrix remodeling-associated protein 8-like n=1 Tax=Polyodon spathula TaxID=7913 RepID=UPI001B7E6883|nr:matrix remodeling-associated protein 8-like [Polyodon spathula]